MQIGRAEQPALAHGKGDEDGVAHQRRHCRSASWSPRHRIGAGRPSSRIAPACSADWAMAPPTSRVVGGDHLAGAVEHRHHRALGQAGWRASCSRSSAHPARSPTVPSKLPSGLCSASMPPITGWPVTRLISSLDTAMPSVFCAPAGRRRSRLTFRPLRQRHGRTDHAAVGVDAGEVGEIAHPDQRIGQHAVAIAAHAAHFGQAAHRAQHCSAAASRFWSPAATVRADWISRSCTLAMSRRARATPWKMLTSDDRQQAPG